MPAGRPSSFTQEIADQICDRISGGESLRKICETESMPDRSTVIRWLASPDHADFASKCARARELQGEAFGEKLQDVNDLVETGKLEANAAKVISGNLQWLAARHYPKLYGDRQQLEHSGPGGGKLEVVVRSVLDAPPKGE